MANIKIKTKGMSCPSCEMLVKDALEDTEGVNKAEASFKDGVVSVDFDDKKVDEGKIKGIIKSEGYKTEGA